MSLDVFSINRIEKNPADGGLPSDIADQIVRSGTKRHQPSLSTDFTCRTGQLSLAGITRTLAPSPISA
jgi:hypothetical protein